MKEVTFSKQLKFGVLIAAICFTVALITEIGIFFNIGWILYGMMFVINPAVPNNMPERKIAKGRVAVRICGVVIVFIGMTMRVSL